MAVTAVSLQADGGVLCPSEATRDSPATWSGWCRLGPGDQHLHPRIHRSGRMMPTLQLSPSPGAISDLPGAPRSPTDDGVLSVH